MPLSLSFLMKLCERLIILISIKFYTITYNLSKWSQTNSNDLLPSLNYSRAPSICEISHGLIQSTPHEIIHVAFFLNNCCGTSGMIRYMYLFHKQKLSLPFSVAERNAVCGLLLQTSTSTWIYRYDHLWRNTRPKTRKKQLTDNRTDPKLLTGRCTHCSYHYVCRHLLASLLESFLNDITDSVCKKLQNDMLPLPPNSTAYYCT